MSSLPVLSLMNQVIGLRKYITEDTTPYHEPQLSATATFPARVQIRQTVSLNVNGSQIPSYATIYTTAEVSKGDVIILPDGSIRTVISAERAVDGNGNFSHSVVTV